MASWLALDWDQDQFHLLSVQTTRRGVQITRAVSWAHPEPFTPSTAERVGKALREFLRDEKVPTAPVVAGIGRDRILLKELRFPPIAAHEEVALVRFQTAKELTEAVDQYAIDYAHLNPDSRDGERQIMTVAVRRDIVQMLQTLCQAAGLKLHAVTPRLFGVASTLTQAVLPEPTPLAKNRRTVVLTLGQRWAELTFYRGERLVQAQALAMGPLLLSEVKRNLAVFQAQHAVEMDVSGPECLYVFGEDAGAIEALQNGVNLPVVVLDPLSQDAPLAAQTKNPGAFAGALGLALLWSQSIQRPVNLSSPKKQQLPTNVTRQRGLIYGAVAAVVLLFVFGMLYSVLAGRRAYLEQLTTDKAKNDEFLKKVGQQRADLIAYKDWEDATIPWLDELYDLTARYPHEVGFRINQLAASTASKKSGKDGFVGRISINGFAPPGKENAVHQLHAALSRDAHLRAQLDRIKPSASQNAPLVFEMKIDIARQLAERYDTRLIVPKAPAPIVLEPEKEEPDAEGGDE